MRGFLIACSFLVAFGCQRDVVTDDIAAAEEVPDGVLATVLGKNLTREDLDEHQAESLRSAVLGSLLEQFREENGIVATEADLQGAVAFMDEKLSRLVEDGVLTPEELVEPDDQGLGNPVAEWMVVSWKTSKALYERYGGTVIFQQSNPMEPVGAYLAFLREQEKEGAFRIHDSELASRFWDYFTRDHARWVVEPGKVDYSEPWWEK